MSRSLDPVDVAIEQLIATCGCDACDRYRKSLAAIVFKLERSMRGAR